MMVDDITMAEAGHFMEKLRDIQQLSVQKRRVSDQGAFGLAKALETNTTLTSLSLRCDGISPIGMRCLVEVLRYSTHITDITMFGHNGNGDERADAVADIIKDSPKLSKLQLINFGICEPGASVISDMLRRNIVLLELSLENNALGPSGAMVVASALLQNYRLMELNLSGNGIGDDGASALADALVTNKTLRVLYLQQNRIRDQGAAFLGDALKVNRSLTRLGLGGNQGICAAGAKVLAKGLRDNSALLWLNGVDLSPFASDVFGIPRDKQAGFTAHNFDNLELLDAAREIRERTRKRYAELTKVYHTKSSQNKTRPVRNSKAGSTPSHSSISGRPMALTADMRVKSKVRSMETFEAKHTVTGDEIYDLFEKMKRQK